MDKLFVTAGLLFFAHTAYAGDDLPLPSEYLCRDVPAGMLSMSPTKLVRSGPETVMGIGFFTGAFVAATGYDLKGDVLAKDFPRFLDALVAECRQKPNANALEVGLDLALRWKKAN